MHLLVTRVLGGVDGATRACVVYHYLDDCTLDETGARLGLSASGVRKRLARFRREVLADASLVADLR